MFRERGDIVQLVANAQAQLQRFKDLPVAAVPVDRPTQNNRVCTASRTGPTLHHAGFWKI